RQYFGIVLIYKMVQLQLNTRCNDIIENLLPTMAQHEVRELLVVLNLSHNGRKARLYRRLLACLDAQSVPISALLKCRSTKLREAARQVDLPRMLFSGVQLPFAEVLGSLIPLTLLIQSEPLSAMQCQLLEFTVKPEHAPLIKAGARLIMRFYKLLGQGESRVDEFPEQLSIRLNSNVLQSEQLAQMRGRVAGVPVDITDHSKTDLCESNKVTVTWCQPDGQRFCLETLLIRYRSVEAELARIPRGSCKSTLFGSLSSGDCQVAKQPASLTCPISMTRIVRPVRGVLCRHLQCFDAASYLSVNRSRLDWRCPCCKLPTQPRQLYVDTEFQEILAAASHDDGYVEFDGPSSWKLIKSESSRGGAGAVASQQTVASGGGVKLAASSNPAASNAVWTLADSESESSDMEIAHSDDELDDAPSRPPPPVIISPPVSMATASAVPAAPAAAAAAASAAPIVIDLTEDDDTVPKEETPDNVSTAAANSVSAAAPEAAGAFKNGTATFVTRQEQWPTANAGQSKCQAYQPQPSAKKQECQLQQAASDSLPDDQNDRQAYLHLLPPTREQTAAFQLPTPAEVIRRSGRVASADLPGAEEEPKMLILRQPPSNSLRQFQQQRQKQPSQFGFGPAAQAKPGSNSNASPSPMPWDSRPNRSRSPSRHSSGSRHSRQRSPQRDLPLTNPRGSRPDHRRPQQQQKGRDLPFYSRSFLVNQQRRQQPAAALRTVSGSADHPRPQASSLKRHLSPPQIPNMQQPGSAGVHQPQWNGNDDSSDDESLEYWQ
ncbi:hypothetical protein BOX15_Mlig022211g1, partial [Macrostomum lignano]